MSWRQAVLDSTEADGLPSGYRREEALIGRRELLESAVHEFWEESEFLGRSQVPCTTSAAEATIRRRKLEQLVSEFPLGRQKPALELGCADGLVTRHLLEVGFRQLVSTDIVHATVANLAQSLTADQRDRVLLVVDDLLRLPLRPQSFQTVVAWGVLSVTMDVERALERAWGWVAPGGFLLLAEPTLESVLAYALVRGDLDEFRRTLSEGTRAAMWDKREERYRVHRWMFYEERLSSLAGAAIERRDGINMLPSLVLGGLAQDSPPDQLVLEELTLLLEDPSLDDLALWRQAFWLVRKDES